MRSLLLTVLLALLFFFGCGSGPSTLALTADQKVVAQKLNDDNGSNPWRVKKWYPAVVIGGKKAVRLKYEVDSRAFGWIQTDGVFFIEGGKVTRETEPKYLEDSEKSAWKD